MAYPPAALPTNRTNATPQQDTHPSDHNVIGQAINDTVAKLGPDPAGGLANTTTKFQAVDNAIANLTNNTNAALTAMKNPNWVAGVDHTSGASGFSIAAASTVVTTNSNGDFSINFLPMFSAPPVVICGADSGNANIIMAIVFVATTASSFSGHAIWSNSDTVATVSNTTVRVNWIAIGPK